MSRLTVHSFPSASFVGRPRGRELIAPAPEITVSDVVEAVGANLLVIGNKGMRGAGRMVIPSVPNRESHRATCDILLVDTSAA